MPAIRLYGRRWHFSSDVVPLPALLGATYHLAWALVMVIGVLASDQWPRHCESSEGVQYVVLFAAFFASCLALVVVEVLLAYHGLQGGLKEVPTAHSHSLNPFQQHLLPTYPDSCVCEGQLCAVAQPSASGSSINCCTRMRCRGSI